LIRPLAKRGFAGIEPTMGRPRSGFQDRANVDGDQRPQSCEPSRAENGAAYSERSKPPNPAPRNQKRKSGDR